MVVLYVPWSSYAVCSRATFNAAMERLHDSGIAFTVLDEDAESTHDWLLSLDIGDLWRERSVGAGTIIWLESGRAVDYDISPSKMSVEDLIARTRKRWA